MTTTSNTSGRGSARNAWYQQHFGEHCPKVADKMTQPAITYILTGSENDTALASLLSDTLVKLDTKEALKESGDRRFEPNNEGVDLVKDLRDRFAADTTAVTVTMGDNTTRNTTIHDILNLTLHKDFISPNGTQLLENTRKKIQDEIIKSLLMRAKTKVKQNKEDLAQKQALRRAKIKEEKKSPRKQETNEPDAESAPPIKPGLPFSSLTRNQQTEHSSIKPEGVPALKFSPNTIAEYIFEIHEGINILTHFCGFNILFDQSSGIAAHSYELSWPKFIEQIKSVDKSALDNRHIVLGGDVITDQASFEMAFENAMEVAPGAVIIVHIQTENLEQADGLLESPNVPPSHHEEDSEPPRKRVKWNRNLVRDAYNQARSQS